LWRSISEFRRDRRILTPEKGCPPGCQSGHDMGPDYPLFPPIPGIMCKNAPISCKGFRNTAVALDLWQTGDFPWLKTGQNRPILIGRSQAGSH
jgi:hypothetical protein